MGTPGFDLGVQSMNQQMVESQRIRNEQTLARQAKLSAIVGDSLNALPLPKDENGNPDINNPIYQQIYAKRQKLIGSLMDEYTPTQHANIVQRIGGLITGNKQHAMPHPNQPLPAMGTGPAALAAQAGGEQAAQAQQDLQASDPNQIPQQPVQNLPLHPMASAPPDHPLHKITEGIKALGEGLKNHAQAFAHPDLPPNQKQEELINNLAASYADPQELAHERRMEEFGLKGTTAENVANIRAQNMRGIPYNSGAMSIEDAIKRAQATGEEFINSATGEPFDTATIQEMLPGSKLVPIVQGKRTTGWLLADQKQRLLNWDNQQHIVGEFNVATDGQIAGLKTVPRESTHQVPGMNPGEVITLHNTSTPVTPAPQQAPSPAQVAPLQNPAAIPPAPAGEPANPTLKTRPTLAPRPLVANPMSASAQALTDKLNGKKSLSKQIPSSADPATYLAKTGVYPDPPPPFAPGTMLSQGKTTKPIVAKADAVAANIFGGGDEKPIWASAYMFDNPNTRAALNKALTMNALANPGTGEDPTLMQQLATSVGATGWSQEQVNAAVVQAKQDLLAAGGPEAMKMFARMAGMQEDLTALRAITGGSAAASTIKTMVRAAPVYNVASAANFRDQLGATLNTAAKAFHAYPELNPAYVKWWSDGAKLARQGPTSANAPKGLQHGTFTVY